MNDTLKQLLNRRSIRNFTGEKVKDEDLRIIFEAAQRCPTSINGQQVSIVYTRNKEKLKQIAKLCGGQKQIETCDVFVTFVIDYNRTSYAIESLGKEHVAEKSVEGVIVGAVDVGIMVSSLQTAAESLGYGTTAIGAVRFASDEFIKILNLPKKTFPLVGTIIGVPSEHATQSPIKPRIALDSFAFEDVYDTKKVEDGIEEYENTLKKFRQDNNMDYKTSYKEELFSYYGRYYMRHLKEWFEKQNFVFKDLEK